MVGNLPSRFFHRLLDRLDAALDCGSIEGHLPDGSVRLLGGRAAGPDAVIHLHRWSGFVQLLLSGSVGWFRAWMAGDWESDDLVKVFEVFSANRLTLAEAGRARGPIRWINHARHALRRNSRGGSRRNIHAHYDLGNDFYASWLDRHMVYSSALFDHAAADEPLEVAQLRKIDAALDRLQLKSGQHLLEIGCGWGALGARAIERHDVRYTGLTLSAEQGDWARPLVLPQGDVKLCDYRDATGQYDAIASIEMVEAVGRSYWPSYLDAIVSLLKPGGRAAIQYIAIDDAIFDGYAANADFIQTYIFPGGCLLSVSEFRKLAQDRGLVWEVQRDFATDYADTLKIWRENYELAKEQGRLPAGFTQHFHRLWHYYLTYCEGGFRGGGITVAQVTLVKAR